jgi:hypothetical protein
MSSVHFSSVRLTYFYPPLKFNTFSFSPECSIKVSIKEPNEEGYNLGFLAKLSDSRCFN